MVDIGGACVFSRKAARGAADLVFGLLSAPGYLFPGGDQVGMLEDADAELGREGHQRC